MTHERYTTLIDMVQKDHDWAVLAILGKNSVAEQQNIIEEFFLAAAMHHDDDVALRYFGYLGKVIEDGDVIPLLGGKDNREVTNYQVVADAKKSALKKRCEKVMELWEKIPAQTTRQSWEQIAEDERRPIIVPSPTLLNTKTRMLDECVAQWSSCEDEEWSLKVFDFLMDIKVYCEKDEECVYGAIEKATADPLKLLRGFLHVVGKISGGFHRDTKLHIAQTLVRKWAMQWKTQNVAVVLGTVAPVIESQEALRFLGRTAVILAEREKQIKPLKRALSPTSWAFQDRSVDIEYITTHSLKVTLRHSPQFTGRNLFDENWAHDKFTEFRDKVARWQNENKDVAVLFLMVMPDSHFPEKPFFVREQKLPL